MKTIALYLPQFHQTVDNDKWWGEGYTDWVATKNAKPLFDGHEQPKKPLHGNYYDLMEKRTMKRQADLARKAKIDGFCFYHYWFKDGRMTLEKPAENLLKWNDIDIGYCFSWANESWVRSWSNIKNGNAWDEIAEDEEKQLESRGVLLEQTYGREKEWKQHFDYLLPFFKDDRYIKVDGKPVFTIYRPELITCLKQMVLYWKKLALEEGLPGLYVIGVSRCFDKHNVLDARLMQEPITSIEIGTIWKKVRYTNDTKCVRYKDFQRDTLTRKYPKREKIYLCACVNYDDTPRRGKRGTVLTDATPYRFYKYFRKLIKLSKERKNEMLFINAWNEWGEGMYLEPDEKYRYGYLNAVRNAIEKEMRI